MNVLFLYTEIAGYFMACASQLTRHENVNVHIVRYPVNSEAPFIFNFNDERIIQYEKSKYPGEELGKLVGRIAPRAIYCAGWTDWDYLKIIKDYSGKAPTILGFDNQWKGSLKQRLATLISPFFFRRIFSHVGIPGKIQLEYARKLGFSSDRILTGFYSADVPYYNSLYNEHHHEKKKDFPKVFLFVGRYVEVKGLNELWEAFMKFQGGEGNDWELWCLGTGPLEKTAPANEKIKHFGFVQPCDMPGFIKRAGVFVLPSKFEPWGVAVHEFSSAGFPLLLSDKVGSASTFLVEDKNGFSVQAGNTGSLAEAMARFSLKTSEELYEMGKISHQMAQQITPEIWAENLVKLICSFKGSK